MFRAAAEDDRMSGAFNAVAPEAVTNAQFMRELRRALHRPWSPPAPAWAVKLGARLMGSEGSLALISQRCVPGKFLAAGFQYRFPDLPRALDDLARARGPFTIDD
jgi:NAD dependent epimerase/dehydratase family enzyme